MRGYYRNGSYTQSQHGAFRFTSCRNKKVSLDGITSDTMPDRGCIYHAGALVGITEPSVDPSLYVDTAVIPVHGVNEALAELFRNTRRRNVFDVLISVSQEMARK